MAIPRLIIIIEDDEGDRDDSKLNNNNNHTVLETDVSQSYKWIAVGLDLCVE